MNFIEINVYGEELSQSNLGIDNSFIMKLSFMPSEIEYFFESEMEVEGHVILTTDVIMKSGNRFMAEIEYNEFKGLIKNGGWINA